MLNMKTNGYATKIIAQKFNVSSNAIRKTYQRYSPIYNSFKKSSKQRDVVNTVRAGSNGTKWRRRQSENPEQCFSEKYFFAIDHSFSQKNVPSKKTCRPPAHIYSDAGEKRKFYRRTSIKDQLFADFGLLTDQEASVIMLKTLISQGFGGIFSIF